MERHTDDHKLNEVLKLHFGTTLLPDDGSSFPFAASDLLDPAGLECLLAIQSARLGGPSQRALGTLFAKRYSVFAQAACAAFSLFDARLELDHHRVAIRVADEGAMRYAAQLASGEEPDNCPPRTTLAAGPGFSAPASSGGCDADLAYSASTDEIAVEPPVRPSFHEAGDEARGAHARSFVQQLLEHLHPVLRAVSMHTGAHLQVMWSLIAHNVFSLYAMLQTEPGYWRNDQRLRLIGADWHALAAVEPFSEAFHRFEHLRWQGKPVYMRTCCCLAYTLHLDGGRGHGYCGTCPRLRPEERLRVLAGSH